MNKIVSLIFLLLLSLFVFSCTDNDDDITSNNEIVEKLKGKWYFEDPKEFGTAYNNSFTFDSNNKVIYSYWVGSSENNFDSEIGKYEVKGDVLTMNFDEGVSLKYVQKVKFISSTKVEFSQVPNSTEQPYKGIFYKN